MKSWLHRIAHNVSLNTLRAARDEVSLDAGQAALDLRPDDAYESAERLRQTLQAVRDLPERQRAALVLRELEGRSHEEIAEALGTTAGGARQHLMRARAAVRQAATAITPYPLIAKMANAVADPSAGRVAEAVAGVGAGATIVKLTAGLAATGALVGGVVGTESVVRRDASPPAAIARQAAPHRAAVSQPARAATASSTAATRGARHAVSGSGARRSASGDRHEGRRARRGVFPAAPEDGGERAGDDREQRSGSRGDDGRSGDDGRDEHRTSTSGSGSGSDDHVEDRSGTTATTENGGGEDHSGTETSSGESSGSDSGSSGSDPTTTEQPSEATTTTSDSHSGSESLGETPDPTP